MDPYYKILYPNVNARRDSFIVLLYCEHISNVSLFHRLGMHLPDLTMDVDTDSGARMPEHIPLPMGSSVTLKVVLPAHGMTHIIMRGS